MLVRKIEIMKFYVFVKFVFEFISNRSTREKKLKEKSLFEKYNIFYIKNRENFIKIKRKL